MKWNIIKTLAASIALACYSLSAAAVAPSDSLSPAHRLLIERYIDSDSALALTHRFGTVGQYDTTHVNVKYLQRLERYENAWRRLIPAYFKLQYAGNMGAVSVGLGWCYGSNRQWETDALWGFIPKYQSKKAKLTFTLKENFTPWKIPCWKQFYFEPLSCGVYFNTVLSDDFWYREPEKYPKGYYWFPTKIRSNLFVGERLTFKIPPRKRYIAKAITIYYELSTCDFYVLSGFSNRYLSLSDYLCLSLGIKFSWF